MSGQPSSSQSGGGGRRSRPTAPSSGAAPPSGSGNNQRPAMMPFYPRSDRGPPPTGIGQPPPTVGGAPGLPQPPQRSARDRLEQIYERTASGHAPGGMHPTGPRVPLTVAPRPGDPMLGNRGILRRQGTPGSTYGDAVADAPQPAAIPPLDFQISMIEICTFFPNWFQIPDVPQRAQRNGWTRKDIAKAQLHARNRLTKANMTTAENRIQKQIGDGGRLYHGLAPEARWNSQARSGQAGHDDDLTANMWELRAVYQGGENTDWGHMLLVDIANSVPLPNWPTGRDRMLLTRCLEFALNNPNLNLDTSHWHLIVHRQNFAIPPFADWRHDDQALNNFRNNVPDPTT